MIDTGSAGTRSSFVLLASGANFSCEVLQSLLARDCAPALLMLPQYPPSGQANSRHKNIFTVTPEQRLLTLAEPFEIVYVPAARQARAAELIRQRSIDYLLVACWPYLIDSILISSVSRAALNLHPSLLPRYRGPDPIAQQLALGDFGFGVSLHLLNQRFDHGDIVARRELSDVEGRPQRERLERDCAGAGVELFIDALSRGTEDWEPMAQQD